MKTKENCRQFFDDDDCNQIHVQKLLVMMIIITMIKIILVLVLVLAVSPEHHKCYCSKIPNRKKVSNIGPDDDDDNDVKIIIIMMMVMMI